MVHDENHQDQRSPENRREFRDEVAAKEARKIRARSNSDRSLWFWLGMMGMVGWAVAVPTLIGLACGIWIDSRWTSRFSWTLTLLFVGLVVGCLNAWYWITKER